MRSRVVAFLCCALLSVAACTTDTAEPDAQWEGPKGVRPEARSQLLQPVAVHAATALPDGRVLISGGCTTPGCGGFEQARRTQLVDPLSREIETGPEMLSARAGGTATVLRDDKLLLAGGYPGEGEAPIRQAEIFDPKAMGFQAVAPMVSVRADHTATRLPDGRVLLCGGFGASGQPLSSCEYFDPASGAFVPGPELFAPRAAHVAVRLSDQVVLIGGTDGSTAVARTEVLHRGRWSAGPRLLVPRVKHAAVALSRDRIFVVGGARTAEGTTRLRSTEVVDLRAGEAELGPYLSEGQYKLAGAVTRLADRRVVIAGGAQVNVYDPHTKEMTVLPQPALEGLAFSTATTVGRRQVLIAGGYDDQITPSRVIHLVRVPR